MLSIEQTRKLLNDPKISEEEVKETRDAFRMLAEIIFEKWQEENQAKTSPKLYPQKRTSLKKQVSI